MITRLQSAMLALVALLACLRFTLADDTRYVSYMGEDGETIYLADNRRPALYTGNFGDCLGSSAINVTRFDAAYYKDNMTVQFHLAGDTNLNDQALMMYIGVFAYGESRFDLTFNPCDANIASLCPTNSSIPIAASGIIPISQEDVANIPSIALSIPDFEGEAILRIFANSTESEIGCYSAVVTNGATFSHPEAVGSVLGIFAFIAMLASFATAIYGEAVPTMRLHYAHSLSVGVVFAVFQHIFFTGALSMNWPSVLVAWWSNFAWSGGMIRTDTMQHSIDRLIGNNLGNTSSVGAATSGVANPDLGGGYDISQIYKRAMGFGAKRASDFAANHPAVRDIASEIYKRDYSLVLKRDVARRTAVNALLRRQEQLADASDGFNWYGHPVAAGLPLPGNFSGFAGTLGHEQIRASNAFMTGFLWFIILLVLVVAATMAFKWVVEGLVRVKVLKQDRLAFFRQHWLGYSAHVALRTCFLAWFMIMFLAIFQFTYNSSGGVKAVAAIVFLIFLVGMSGIAAYACWYKIQRDNGNGERTSRERKMLFGKIPWFGSRKAHHESGTQTEEQQPNSDPDDKTQSTHFWQRMNSHYSITTSSEDKSNIHDDEDYIKKFGWLAARFRRTRWWFFAYWLLYEFVRACFYGGASGQALTQVFGLLVVEILAFAFVIWARPFEGMRLNIIVVYCLGFSKVASVALSAAFDIRFNLERITTTVIGVVIIVIQGILVIITLIAIVVSAISSYMSVSRNQEDFRPRRWHGLREKYFNHLDRVANDVPREPKVKPAPGPEPEEKDPYFEVRGIRRLGKIEDDDPDPVNVDSTLAHNPDQNTVSIKDKESSAPLMNEGPGGTASPSRRSRAPSAASMSQSTLPFGARPHRPSWSQRDFSTYSHNADGDSSFAPVDMSRSMPEDDSISPPRSAAQSRTPSRGAPQIRTQPSSESLGVGGDISSRDVIGKVPAPTMRPRAGTWNSRHSARNSTGGGDFFFDAPESSGARMPLTPAQEAEEYLTKGYGTGEHHEAR
ncbi:hypothetical protein Q7P37_001884 [Cladosporium fusiforme]